ncbi:putative AC transposase [Grifola frondosa]|uniref:Putative AC transposase n=1 Tax=Grifola frondosa TaxID=5627 RepID=A0A1C7LR37_GRIFR|nr:putative AC transposase [Grifola frondosa]
MSPSAAEASDPTQIIASNKYLERNIKRHEAEFEARLQHDKEQEHHEAQLTTATSEANENPVIPDPSSLNNNEDPPISSGVESWLDSSQTSGTHKRRATTIDSNSSSEEDGPVNTPAPPPENTDKTKKGKNSKRARRNTVESDDADEDGMLKDVDVQAIAAPQPTRDELRCDVDNFFHAPYLKTGFNGKEKGHRDCKLCRPKATLVNEITTLRRHLEARHVGVYRKWAEENDFESRLPGDILKCKDALKAECERQQCIDGHLKKLSPKDRIIAYSEQVFREAAIEWLIATDQPISALEHPKFKAMIDMAARATDGVKIPTHKAARKEIIRMFNAQMAGLRRRLNSDNVRGEVSLTCNAWQAGNVDAYFAVTAHWIDESEPGRIEKKTGKVFNYKNRRINRSCLAHVINLAMQALIATYSKTPHFDPEKPEAHLNVSSGAYRDEVRLIRAIAVKERSSSKRKEIFRRIQVKAGAKKVTQLLIDMRVRWSSTYLMLHRAESNKEHVDTFVYEIGREEKDLTKCRKIDDLKLSMQEWVQVKLFLDLLGHADNVQQSFSSDQVPSLHLAIPTLEALHKAWSSRAERNKYRAFSLALHVAVAKIETYYNKTEDSDAYVVSMYLVPDMKSSHFEKYWSEELQVKAKEHMETIFEHRYEQLHASTSATAPVKKTLSRTTSLLRELSDDEDNNTAEHSSSATPSLSNPQKPWLAEFRRYLETAEHVLEGMSIIQWWGYNAHRYPVWASLARDYLAIMASSVSSERAFSQGGITISDRRNRLKGDVVEALQTLKCALRQDLLFRSPAPSSSFEQNVEETDDMVDSLEDTAEEGAGGWDIILDDDDDDLYTDTEDDEGHMSS